MVSNLQTYYKYKEAGVCVRCGAPRSGNTLVCEEHRKKANKNANNHYKRNPEKHRAAMRRLRYGLSNEQYTRLFEAQGGCCAICKQSLTNSKNGQHVDHSHATGGVRGLLCGNCNNGLGQFKDSPELLLAAVAYLRNNQDTP